MKGSFSWSHIQAFLVSAESGSLSAASRVLGLTQPTLSRQIASLEQALGVTLFERGPRSLLLTEVGHELLSKVKVMGAAADLVSLVASRQSKDLEGQVVITASDVMSTYHLPLMIKKLQQQAPGLHIQIVSSNEVRDLYKREADIAIRHVRPQQLDLITRLLRESCAVLCAAPSYVQEYGLPATLEQLNNAKFIGFDSLERSIAVINSMGLAVTEKNFRVVCDNGLVGIELLKQGLGIGLIDEQTSRLLPGVQTINVAIKPLRYPIWLTTHCELHTSTRIRFVYDFLAAELLQA